MAWTGKSSPLLVGTKRNFALYVPHLICLLTSSWINLSFVSLFPCDWRMPCFLSEFLGLCSGVAEVSARLVCDTAAHPGRTETSSDSLSSNDNFTLLVVLVCRDPRAIRIWLLSAGARQHCIQPSTNRSAKDGDSSEAKVGGSSVSLAVHAYWTHRWACVAETL
jgi:hypothetical protein